MRQSAAVLCHDKTSLQPLEAGLQELGIELTACSNQKQALELVLDGRCSTLIVDFDLPGAEEVIRMAALLPPHQKPVLLAVASRAWPGTGQAFQSGASRILYRPLDPEQLKDALKASHKAAHRKSARFEVKTLVYLELPSGTLSAISIDIGEHGLALQATEPVPMNSNMAFRCVLPGTDVTIHGRADVIWASDHGRAGLFFTQLSPEARKHLKHWMGQRLAHSKKKAHAKDKDNHGACDLLPPHDEQVAFAVSE
jgi:CheY-like chemotaxis protein